MGCINKLTAAVSYDCTNVANRAKSGLEAKAVLINKSDIDLTTLTQSGATVTSMLLTSGKTGFDVSWIKQLGTSAAEFSVNDGFDTFQQSFACRVFGSGAADAKLIKELAEAEFVLVYETKYKGAGNSDSYKVFGLENGLKMSEGSFTSNENDGSFLFTLASLEGFGERYPYQIYAGASYSAATIKFNANFA
jgi:hypothetical protein